MLRHQFGFHLNDEFGREFETLSMSVVEKAFNLDPEKALLIVERPHPHWGEVKVLPHFAFRAKISNRKIGGFIVSSSLCGVFSYLNSPNP